MVGHLRVTPLKPLGKSGLRQTFCDRRPSVQSPCNVRVEGNYYGLWEEAPRGSFFRAKGQMVFSTWDHAQHTIDSGLASLQCCVSTFFIGDGHILSTQCRAHLLSLLFCSAVWLVSWDCPFVEWQKGDLVKHWLHKEGHCIYTYLLCKN